MYVFQVEKYYLQLFAEKIVMVGDFTSLMRAKYCLDSNNFLYIAVLACQVGVNKTSVLEYSGKHALFILLTNRKIKTVGSQHRKMLVLKQQGYFFSI